jgi:hypothetical protein
MYGNIVSSSGLLQIDSNSSEREITFTIALSYLCLNVENASCMLYLNDDPDGIFLPTGRSSEFVIDNIPIWKMKIKRYNQFTESFESTGNKIRFSYYGYY